MIGRQGHSAPSQPHACRARRTIRDVQTGTQVPRLADGENGQIEPHFAAIAQQVQHFDGPASTTYDGELAGEAHRLERRPHVDLAVRRLEHKSVPPTSTCARSKPA